MLAVQLSLMLNAEAADTRRFALVVGANDGGPDRVELRFAVDDARSVSDVLGALGGVASVDRILLVEPSRDALAAGLADLRVKAAQAKAAGERSEVVVYWSGHSDEDGLLLGTARYGWSELRGAVAAIPADVRLVVLDSCASGAAIRSKGGSVRPAFLADESVDVTGTAFLTSSSADEAAQESDRIGGSFFTHYLVSGLRGAADTTGDGRVTLNEAYQFAYAETLQRTERLSGGAQHANYDIRLAGAGDLVMTDIAGTSAGVVVGDDVEGRLFLRDGQGHLVVEVYKSGSRPVSLGLEPGSYDVTLERDGGLYSATITLVDGETYPLVAASFHAVNAEFAVARGAAATREVPVSFGLLPVRYLTVPAPAPGQVIHAAFSLGVNGSIGVDGLGLALFGNTTRGDARGAQIAFGFDAAREVRGGQISVGVNAAKGLAGAQVATGLNAVGTLHSGGQAALVNVAGAVERGFQLGVFNAAGHVDHGVQVGLVNVAGHNTGTSIGLISVSRDGYNHLWLEGSEYQTPGLGVTFGGRRVFQLVEAGVRPGSGSPWVGALYGVGVHTEGERLWFDVDLSSGAWYQHQQQQQSPILGVVRLRPVMGVKVAKGVGVFAGPSVSASPWHLGDAPKRGWAVGEVPVWVGASAGIRF